MTDLAKIETEIRNLLRTDRASRPFLCEGSPLDCRVALVGINPGTDTPFWPYWNTKTGCDKRAWLADFCSNAANSTNATRPRIEVVLGTLAPVKCIELNIYPYFSREAKDLPNDFKDVCVFDYMFSLVRPELMFVFGTDPINEISTLLGLLPLPRGKFTACAYKGNRFEVYADTHLSRGWSYIQRNPNEVPRVQALGQVLKHRFEAIDSRNAANKGFHG